MINFYKTRFHYQTDREMGGQLTHLLCAEGNWFKCDFTGNRKKLASLSLQPNKRCKRCLCGCLDEYGMLYKICRYFDGTNK